MDLRFEYRDIQQYVEGKINPSSYVPEHLRHHVVAKVKVDPIQLGLNDGEVINDFKSGIAPPLQTVKLIEHLEPIGDKYWTKFLVV